jgi:hypothetical protein
MAMQNGGVASVTLEYLPTQAAPMPGDERLRVAETRGVIETALIQRNVTHSLPNTTRRAPSL